MAYGFNNDKSKESMGRFVKVNLPTAGNVTVENIFKSIYTNILKINNEAYYREPLVVYIETTDTILNGFFYVSDMGSNRLIFTKSEITYGSSNPRAELTTLYIKDSYQSGDIPVRKMSTSFAAGTPSITVSTKSLSDQITSAFARIYGVKDIPAIS